MRLVEVEPGRVTWEAEPGEHLYNPIGTVHAGFATTLLDSAMGTAFVSVADAGTRWTTLELKANFTRAITADTGPVRCVGTVVHQGRTVVTTEARLEDARARLLAHGTSTILVLSGRRPTERHVVPTVRPSTDARRVASLRTCAALARIRRRSR